MTREEFLSELAEIMEYEDDPLSGEEELDSLEDWDSLAVMAFIAMVDKNFSMSIGSQQIKGCKTVDDLILLVDGRLG